MEQITLKKRCWSCKGIFPATLEFYHSDKTKVDNLHGCCSICSGKSKNKANPRKKFAIWPRINKEARNKKYIWFAKEQGCCVLCGEQQTEVLLFHHKNPKDKIFLLSKPKSRPLDEIQSEIDACDIMCSNCHISLHYWKTHK